VIIEGEAGPVHAWLCVACPCHACMSACMRHTVNRVAPRVEGLGWLKKGLPAAQGGVVQVVRSQWMES